MRKLIFCVLLWAPYSHGEIIVNCATLHESTENLANTVSLMEESVEQTITQLITGDKKIDRRSGLLQTYINEASRLKMLQDLLKRLLSVQTENCSPEEQ